MTKRRSDRGTKRVKQKQRREHKMAAREQKDIKREEKHRKKALFHPRLVEKLDNFVANFRTHKQFSLAVEYVIKPSEDLDLLKNPDLKWHVAAAISSIFRTWPNGDKTKAQIKKEYFETINRAAMLFTVNTKRSPIRTPYHIEQHIVSWMVTGDKDRLDEVYRCMQGLEPYDKETPHIDELRGHALDALEYHATKHPDFLAWLEGKEIDHTQAKDDGPDLPTDEQIKEFATSLSTERDIVVFLQFDRDEEKVVVGTQPGMKRIKIQKRLGPWPVIQREATPEEIETARKDLESDEESPI